MNNCKGCIKLYFIRHGRQNSELCNTNCELSKAGIEQAELVGKRLTEYHIDRLYSSKLIRAEQTADVIYNALINKQDEETVYRYIPYVKYEELGEIDFGELTGLSNNEIKVKYSDFIKKRVSMEDDIAFPGGECGEDVYNRAMPIIREIIDEAIENEAMNIAIVTHGGLIRAMLAGMIGCGFDKKLLFARELENSSITEIDYYVESGRFYIERVNDYAHLEKKEKLLRKYFKRSL